MFTWNFWREALERAVKSAAQAPLVFLSVAKITDAFKADWQMVAGAALFGFIYSVLTSLATMKIGADESPSAIK